MKSLMVSSITKMAITEEQGLKLRREIETYIDSEDAVLLDFTDVDVFATMFFNASIGYFIMKLTPESCEKKIQITNISRLGMDTYLHTVENAKNVMANAANEREIGKITEQSILEE